MSQQQLLQFQADLIEQVLGHNDIAARVTGGEVLPRLTRFRLSLLGPQSGDAVARVQKLAQMLALRIGVSGEVRIRRHQSQVVVEVPHEGSAFQPIYLLNLQKEIGELPAQTLLLGVDELGLPLMIRPASPSVAHILVAGTTGSGKSMLMASMALSMALNNPPDQARLVLIDPKGCEFGELDGLPHLLLPVVQGLEDEAAGALAVMEKLIVEMELRDKARGDFAPIFVFVDELADLMMVGGDGFQAALTRLIQRGRGAGIHIIAGTQKPTAEVIGTLIKANFPTRIVGAVVSPEDAKVATGIAGTGAEKLLGNGDFLLIARGQQIRFQAAYISIEKVRQIVTHLSGQGRHQDGDERRWQIDEEEPAKTITQRLRKLVPFPIFDRNGGVGHHEQDPDNMVVDARAGMTAWQLRQKYKIGGPRAERLVQQYGLTAEPKEAK